MSSKLKVLQVIPKLGYGGAETGCYDLAHYLHEQNAKSYIVTSGGPLLKYVEFFVTSDFGIEIIELDEFIASIASPAAIEPTKGIFKKLSS